MHGIVTEKTDVFAFGVLLLELITGRQPIDEQQLSLVMWVSLFTLLASRLCINGSVNNVHTTCLSSSSIPNLSLLVCM
jgi:hypothetical protein